MTVLAVDALRRSALYPVQDQLQISTMQLHAMAMARAHGFDPDAIDRLSVVATAMGNNIVRHAGRGQIILRTVGECSSGCMEILALDKGPGIADMTRVMREDGVPADADSRDGGLAGIRRLSDLFDIYSFVGRGTAVLAHVGARTGEDSTCRCNESVLHGCVGAVCVPLHGEEACGDAWAVEFAPTGVSALLVDGLGHGPNAAGAASAAITAFRDSVGQTPEVMLDSMHTALRVTRGAALSVTVIDRSRQTARFCGVGNVDGRVVTVETNRHLIPQNGIVGHTMPRPLGADVPWPSDARLIMHSDGISQQWRADQYPGLLARHPALLAGIIFRDAARARDDATVLVLRDPVTPIAA